MSINFDTLRVLEHSTPCIYCNLTLQPKKKTPFLKAARGCVVVCTFFLIRKCNLCVLITIVIRVTVFWCNINNTAMTGMNSCVSMKRGGVDFINSHWFVSR